MYYRRVCDALHLPDFLSLRILLDDQIASPFVVPLEVFFSSGLFNQCVLHHTSKDLYTSLDVTGPKLFLGDIF